MKRLIITFGLLLIMGILAGCSGTSNILPPAELVEFKPTLKANEIWTKNIGDGSDDEYIYFAPVLQNDIVYTASYDGYVMAVDSHNGSTIWTTGLDDVYPSATPLVTKEHVYVGTLYGHLIKIDIRNGGKLWQKEVPSSVFAAPVAANDLIVVNTWNGEVSAYKNSSGDLVWSQVVGSPPLMLTGNGSPVLSGNGHVYVGMDNGELWAFDVETGVKQWDVPIAVPEGGSDVSRMVDIVGTPVLEDGIIYVVTYQGNVAAVNSNNGAIIWKKEMSSYDSVAVGYSALYVTDSDSYIYSFDKSTGVQRWEQKVLEGRSVTAPAIVGNYIVVSDFEGYVHFFNQRDGKYVARVKVGGDGISSQAVVSGDRVYIQTNNGTLAALQINS